MKRWLITTIYIFVFLTPMLCAPANAYTGAQIGGVAGGAANIMLGGSGKKDSSDRETRVQIGTEIGAEIGSQIDTATSAFGTARGSSSGGTTKGGTLGSSTLCSPFPSCLYTSIQFTPSSGDLSMVFLTRIFGSVGNVLAGPSSTLLSTLMGVFNNAFVGLIGILFTYTTTRAIFDTANDGEPMGKKMDSLTIIRSVGGLSLVFPIYAGYSALQLIVMWMVVQGIGLADTTWNVTLKYINSGGAIYSGAASSNQDTVSFDTTNAIEPAFITNIEPGSKYEDSSPSQIGSAGILRSQICIHAAEAAVNSRVNNAPDSEVNTTRSTINKINAFVDSQKNLNASEKNNFKNTALATIKAKTSTTSNQAPFVNTFGPSYDDTNYIVFFPGGLQNQTLSYATSYSFITSGNPKKLKSITPKFQPSVLNNLAGLNGKCGTFLWGWTPEQKYQAQDLQYIQAKRTALVGMIKALDQTASDIFNASAGQIAVPPPADNQDVASDDDVAEDAPDETPTPNPMDQEDSDTSEDAINTISNTAYSTYIVNAALGYQIGIYPNRLAAGPNKDYTKLSERGSLKSFYDDAIKKGWIMAGSYYYDLASVQATNILESTYYLIKSRDKSQKQLLAPPMVGKNPAYENTTLQNISDTLNNTYHADSIAARLVTTITQTNTYTDDALTMAKNISAQNTGADNDSTGQLLFKPGSSFLGFLKKTSVTQPGSIIAIGNTGLRNVLKSDDGIFQRIIFKKTINSISIKVPKKDWVGLIPLKAGSIINTKIPKTSLININISADDIVLWPVFLCIDNVLSDWYNIMVRNCLIKEAGADFISKQLCPNYNKTTGKLYLVMPIEKLQRFGLLTMDNCFNAIKAILRAVIAVYFIFAAIKFGMAILSSIAVLAWAFPVDAAVSGWANFVNGVYKLVEIAMLSLFPIAMAIIGPLLVNGVILGIYLPLVPFMLFTFGIIGWLILVIEAMVAAPLVALGLTHPEGQNLMGKSEQTLMLILQVFLRPTLLLLGLIASIILSYVALDVLNATFSNVIDALASAAPTSSTSGLVSTVKFLFAIIMYTFICMALVNQCFALIHLLHEKITRWIGSPGEQGMEAQLLSEVKGGAQQFAQAGVDMAGKATATNLGAPTVPSRKKKDETPKPGAGGSPGSKAVTEK